MEREEAVKKFRKQWNWMAENGTEEEWFIDAKVKYFEVNRIKPIPENCCYLCAIEYEKGDCLQGARCAINWGKGKSCMTGLYDKLEFNWKRMSLKQRKEMILKIANLPEK